ncbi:hypothetical protein F6W79_19735 [Vibrio diabolicus]|nr:hypothetical protein F6W79_19735 [Vibrio diabolicus]
MFVGCLIGFWSWLVVSLTGSKCGKGKSIETFEIAVSSQLWVSRVQNLLCCLRSAFRGRWNLG